MKRKWILPLGCCVIFLLPLALFLIWSFSQSYRHNTHFKDYIPYCRSLNEELKDKSFYLAYIYPDSITLKGRKVEGSLVSYPPIGGFSFDGYDSRHRIRCVCKQGNKMIFCIDMGWDVEWGLVLLNGPLPKPRDLWNGMEEVISLTDDCYYYVGTPR